MGKSRVEIDDPEWANPFSSIAEDVCNDGGRPISKYSGSIIYNGIEFTFSAREHPKGRYPGHGTISAISPDDGYVLQVVGKEKTKRLEARDVRRKADELSMPESCLEDEKNRKKSYAKESRRDKILNVSKEFVLHGHGTESAKRDILKAAKKLYAENAPLLAKRLQQSSRPESITPIVAFAAYGDKFLATCFPKLKKSQANYRSQIGSFLQALPNVPMSEIRPSDISRAIALRKPSNSEIHRLHKLWQFLIDGKLVVGVNPVPGNRGGA